MTDLSECGAPRRYFPDNNGQRVLIGLTIEETLEFETLDGLSEFDDGGSRAACHTDGRATATREQRWLELYVKHDEAWKTWLVETRGDRGQTLIIS
jgi:hypothetical protein